MIRIKICGTTSVEDALLAADAGAHAIGMIFYKKSPRAITMKTAKAICAALPPFVATVGVFVNEKPDKVRDVCRQAGIDYAQLHGDEPPEEAEAIGRRVIKAVSVREEGDLSNLDRYTGVPTLLLDTPKEGFYGGTGRGGNLALLESAATRARQRGQSVLLAGGLTPENVTEAIRQVRPWGVDVVSGVEAAPGKKDEKKVRQFVRAALAAGMDQKK